MIILCFNLPSICRHIPQGRALLGKVDLRALGVGLRAEPVTTTSYTSSHRSSNPILYGRSRLAEIDQSAEGAVLGATLAVARVLDLPLAQGPH